ncbi:MAG: hypothetical protein R3C28_25225 [Pirellulaceae bacterium]
MPAIPNGWCKAEAGKPIAQRTICGLRDAFRQAGQKITLDELLQNPVSLAGQFLKQLLAAGSLVISRSADFIDADATFEFAGNPSVFAFSGQHHGTAAACRAFEAFSRHFQLPRLSATEHFQLHATGHGHCLGQSACHPRPSFRFDANSNGDPF